MKKWYWLIATVVILFVGDRMMGKLLENIVLSSQFRYSRMYRGDAAADILLVGNSRGLIFYQPFLEEQLGVKTFNLSYNGLPADLTDVLVKDYLDLYPKPKLVLIDVSLCDRINKELINGFATYASQSKRIKELIRNQDAKVAGGLEASWLYRYNSEVFQRALFYKNKSDEDWLLDRKITEEIKAKLTPDYEFIIKYPEEMPKQLGETVAYLRKQNINVQLVLNPYYPPFVDHITNLDEFIKEIEAATQMKVANYATAVQKEAYFGDFQHLNKVGSKVYLEQLIKDGLLETAKE
ncbi:MAG: hypothetical protein MK226_15250 [Saprospiraceae bacterium]|nr:hypothetical protein [Saprospiraceae bacterium]